MKKYLLAIIAMVAFGVCYAIVPDPIGCGNPSCTIPNSGNSSISVNDHHVEHGVLYIEVGNDSEVPANAIVEVEFYQKDDCKSLILKRKTVGDLVPRMSSKTLKIYGVPEDCKSYKITGLKANRCNN